MEMQVTVIIRTGIIIIIIMVLGFGAAGGLFRGLLFARRASFTPVRNGWLLQTIGLPPVHSFVSLDFVLILGMELCPV